MAQSPPPTKPVAKQPPAPDKPPVAAPSSESSSAPEEATLSEVGQRQAAAPASKVAVEAVEVQEKSVLVTPLINTGSIRIGKSWYTFQQGVQQKVPAGVAAHLKTKGIIPKT